MIERKNKTYTKRSVARYSQVAYFPLNKNYIKEHTASKLYLIRMRTVNLTDF